MLLGLEARSGCCIANKLDCDVGLGFTELCKDFLEDIRTDGNGIRYTSSIFVRKKDLLNIGDRMGRVVEFASGIWHRQMRRYLAAANRFDYPTCR